MSFKKAAVMLGVALAAAAPAQAAHIRALSSFSQRASAFGLPYVDSAGDLFGTTALGGRFGYGTVFMLAPDGTTTVLHDFKGGRDGAHPNGGVIGDAAGNLYGTTFDGGSHVGGTLFKLAPDGKLTSLHAFGAGMLWEGNGPDARGPSGSLAIDAGGNLYGTGSHGGTQQFGAIYEYAADGTYSLLHSFINSDGSQPHGLVLAQDGALYGTTLTGGTGDILSAGTVYKITPGGSFTSLYSFGAKKDGYTPTSEVAVDSGGNVYGTTDSGGGVNAYGIAFRIAPDGTETVLHRFRANGIDGTHPLGRVALDASGNLYGTTIDGGQIGSCGDQSGCGVLFEVSPQGKERVVHYFDGGSDGGDPVSGLATDGHGRYFGTTYDGGTSASGVVFEFNK